MDGLKLGVADGPSVSEASFCQVHPSLCLTVGKLGTFIFFSASTSHPPHSIYARNLWPLRRVS
jgi:hypothetical protein